MLAPMGVLVHNAFGDTGTYNALRKSNKGSGNEVQHIVEKRFLKYTNSSSAGQMQSVVLTKAQHRTYTNMWRNALPYGGSYTKAQVKNAASYIYSNNKTLYRLAMSSF